MAVRPGVPGRAGTVPGHQRPPLGARNPARPGRAMPPQRRDPG